MNKKTYQERLQRCGQLMQAAGIDVLILVKPANMHYLTGDGRLCAYAVITKDLQVVMGVPRTDIEDVKRLAHFDHIVGFENEVGLIHSVAHYFKDFGITKGVVGLEFEEAPLPAGHAFFHGEKGPGPLAAGTVIALGNCGLYTGPWGVRNEDTVAVGQDGPIMITSYLRQLE